MKVTLDEGGTYVRPLTEHQKQIIRAMAECDMNISAAARKLYYHRRSVEGIVTTVRRNTGLDARKFYELIKLLEIADDNYNGTD